MSPIFTLWGRILRKRADVYVQLLLTIVGAALLAGLMAVAARGHASGLVILVGVLAVVAEVAFGYGAALGALGEAARGDASSPFWARGYRLWGRTLGLFAVDFLVAIALTIVLLIVLGLAGSLAGLGHLTSAATLATPGIRHVLVVLGIGVLVLAIVVGPYMQAAQAIIYVADVPVLPAFAQAFTEAYGRGRFGHWLLGLLVAVVLDLVASLIEQLLGTTGQLLSILLSPAVLWLSTALAFAIYRTHSLGAAPADIIS